MKSLVLSVATCMALTGYGSPAAARDVKKFVDTLADAQPGIFFTGVMYRPGMKITRPGASNDGGYPYGSFAVFMNDNGSSIPGGAVHYLDGGAQLFDLSMAPWFVEFDSPVKSFSVGAYEPPGSIAVVWIKAYDATGALIAEQRIKKHSYETNALTLKVTAPIGKTGIVKVEMNYEVAVDYASPYPFAPYMNWEMLTWESL